jgi:SAM-dependent methyltransferase
MPLAVPPELELKNIRALLSAGSPQDSFAGLRVLEVGIGDGRLAQPLAADAELWVGIDLDRGELASARLRGAPPSLCLVEGDAGALGFDAETFDVVFFSWSLCCILPADMAGTLAEAQRVLRTEGLLLDLHATEDLVAVEVWHALGGGNGRPDGQDSVRRTPIGLLEPDDGPPHGFAEATDALAAALDTGFTLHRSVAFDYHYFFDSPADLAAHLKDTHEFATASEALLEKADAAMKPAVRKVKLVTSQRVVATALGKL